MFAGCGTKNPNKLDLELDLLAASDSGVTWSKIPATSPALSDYGNPDHVPVMGCEADFAFLDSLHGWITVTVHGETMNSFSGTLLTTSDGGRTWKQAAHNPGLGFAQMLLVTPSDGWLFGAETDSEFHGDSSDKELYVTHDATRSWQKITLAAPKEIAPANCYVHSLPVFEDSRHGLLQVFCSSMKDGKYNPSWVLFATKDSGQTWKPDRMVVNLDDTALGQYGSPTVVGSDWIFAAQLDHRPMLTKVGTGARIDASTNAIASGIHYGDIDGIDFATPAEGWVIVGNGNLLSTTDGGANWVHISPGPKPHVIHPLKR